MKRFNERRLENFDAIHVWFELTYSAYLVLPRSLLQSMPQEWQSKFVKLLEEMDEAFDLPEEYTANYMVQMRGENGKFVPDPFAAYDRGRRKVPLRVGADKRSED